MSLVLLEGLDKCGKTTVAEYFKKQGYKYVHMTTPPKGISKVEYFADMMSVILATAGKNVIIDRSWYGECVWPLIFNRESLLSGWDIFLLDQLCKTLHSGNIRKIYMYDDNKEAHIARLLQFKEPSYDYDTAYKVHKEVMAEHEFEFLTFQEAEAKGWILKEG